MKKIYTLLAAVAVILSMSVSAPAADTDSNLPIRILWQSVEVVPNGDNAELIAKIKVQSVDNQPFSGDVLAILCSTGDTILAQSRSYPVELNADNNYTSDELVIETQTNPFWPKYKNAETICYIYMNDDTHNETQVDHMPVYAAVPAGIAEVEAEDNSVTEVYDLNGVRIVSGDDVNLQPLAPGVYIVRKGLTYSKVLHR